MIVQGAGGPAAPGVSPVLGPAAQRWGSERRLVSGEGAADGAQQVGGDPVGDGVGGGSVGVGVDAEGDGRVGDEPEPVAVGAPAPDGEPADDGAAEVEPVGDGVELVVWGRREDAAERSHTEA